MKNALTDIVRSMVAPQPDPKKAKTNQLVGTLDDAISDVAALAPADPTQPIPPIAPASGTVAPTGTLDDSEPSDADKAAKEKEDADKAAVDKAAADKEAADKVAKEKGTMDDTSADPTDAAMSAADYADANIALRAAAAIQDWVETDDLDEGESLADRALAGFVGIADADQDGELTDDEQDVVADALEAGYDYLLSMGVANEDCDALFNDWDDEAANRIRDVVAAALPDGEDEALQHMDDFAFGPDLPETNGAGVALDAVYRGRHSKKPRVTKKLTGHVRLSARQKVGIRKAHNKSHSAGAMKRRSKRA